MRPDRGLRLEGGGESVGPAQRYRLNEYPQSQRATAVVVGLGEDAAGIDYLIDIESLVHRCLRSQMIFRLSEDTCLRRSDISVVAVALLRQNQASW